MPKKIFAILLIALLAVTLVSCGNFPAHDENANSGTGNGTAAVNGKLKITLIDVGQGDSIFVQSGQV